MSFTTPTVDVYVPGTTLGLGNVNAGTINIGKAGTTINVGGSMAVTNSVTTPSCTMTSLTTGNLIISPFSGDVAFNNFSAVNATIGNASMINASFNSLNSSNILIGPYPVSGTFTNLAVTNGSINNVSATNLTSVNVSANSVNVSNLLITPLLSNPTFTNLNTTNVNLSTINGAFFFVGTENNPGRHMTMTTNNITNTSTTAYENTAFGYGAMGSVTTGSQNTLIGGNAGAKLTSGARNVVVGADALYEMTLGYDNIAIGAGALNGGGSYRIYNGNLAIGTSALGYTYGERNTAIGYNSNSNLTSGYQNTALGHQTHFNLTTGSNNIAIGYTTEFNLTTGSNNIAIGMNASTGTTCEFSTVLGPNATSKNFSYSTAIGYNASCTENNQIVLGNSTETVLVPGTLIVNNPIRIGYTATPNVSSLIGFRYVIAANAQTTPVATTWTSDTTQQIYPSSGGINIGPGVWLIEIGFQINTNYVNRYDWGISTTNNGFDLTRTTGAVTTTNKVFTHLSTIIQNTTATNWYVIAAGYSGTLTSISISYINVCATRIA